MKQEELISVRTKYLVVGVISMLFAGILYGWSILKTPLGEEFGWSASMLGTNYTTSLICFCLGGLLSGVLLKRFRPRVVALLSALLGGSGFALVSTLTGENIVQLYLFYGVMGGLSIGLAYNVVISTVAAWYPDKKGVCSGFMMMGFGGSTLVLGNLAGMLFTMDTVGWRTTYLMLGIGLGGVMAVTAFILRTPPPEAEFPPVPQTKQKKETIPQQDYTPVEMMKRFSFWRYFIFTMSLSAVGGTVIGFAKDMAMSVGAPSALATFLVGVLSISNGAGRVFAGILYDHTGRRVVMTTASIFSISGAVTCLAAITVNSLPLCILGFCFSGLAYGFNPTIISTVVATFYGQKDFSTNFAIVNGALIPASLVINVANQLLETSGWYTNTFLLLTAVAVMLLLMGLSVRRP